MNINNFTSGTYVQEHEYKAFLPTLINTEWSWEDPQISTLLEKAVSSLGELNAYSKIVPDIELYITLHVAKEASASSRIEGTQTEIDEVLRSEEEVAPERKNDWQEVRNYIRAMNHAINELVKLPVSNRLLKNAHGILMQGVRGEGKVPGKWRRTQNWIGGPTLREAHFIPPPHQHISKLMTDLERFWHNESIDVPHIIRIAISHYQFETIHPFLDGNGRLGRLLITLYLIEKGFLANPSLYLSSYIEENKESYYQALTIVRTTGDLGHWVKFFLLAVYRTAEKGASTFRAILELREAVEKKILSLGSRADKGRHLLNKLYQLPIISTKEAAEHLEVEYKTASRLIEDFRELHIVTEVTGKQRNKLFLFGEYYTLFTHKVGD